MGQEPPTKPIDDSTGEDPDSKAHLNNDETLLGEPGQTQEEEPEAFQIATNLRRIGRYELR